MNDLISRKAAIDAVAEILKRVFVEYRDIAEKIINKLPSAEPERKTGRWSFNLYADVYRFCCSECKANHRAKYDFCPSCGAYMGKEVK